MKPEIENLKVWISGRSTTGYQRALGMREFEQLLSYVTELEQLRQPPVVGRSEQLKSFYQFLDTKGLIEANEDYSDEWVKEYEKNL